MGRLDLAFYLCGIYFILLGCATSRMTTSNLDTLFENNPTFEDHFTGFSLFNPATGENLYSHQSDKFFTPASNTKILTLYTALNMFEDSIPTIRYHDSKDTLYIWGMSDPTTLHPKFGQQGHVFSFLKSKAKPIVICTGHFKDPRFGAGWAWDDYPYAYQAEKTHFPLFGNVAWLTAEQKTGTIQLYPNIPNVQLSESEDFQYQRAEHTNNLQLSIPRHPKDEWSWQLPLVFSDSFYKSALHNTLNNNFEISQRCPALTNGDIYYSTPSDTVYAYMMQTSDNFIAEHLLMGSSAMLLDSIDSKAMISYVKSHMLRDIDSELLWYDGSGLSRYNMLTPQAIVSVLDRIRKQISDQGIKKIFPAGGVSGTIRDWYHGSDNQPFVFAKTGTLRGVHCLSGYLYTDKGTVLIFSFMHNNFRGSPNRIKESMNQVLQHIKSHY